MRVSIVIPIYNAERYLARTLTSVLRQSFTDWEAVLIDDGSKDRSYEIAADFAAEDGRIRLFRQPNAGVSAARNSGFMATSPASEYIVFLDNDDTWEPDSLRHLVEALEMAPNAVAAHGVSRIIDAEDRLIQIGEAERLILERFVIDERGVHPYAPNLPTRFETLLFHNYIPSPGQGLMRRSALERMELFDVNCNGTDDWDVWLRLSLQGPIEVVGRIILNYRRHTTNASHNIRAMRANMLYVRRKLLRNPDLTPQQRALVTYAHSWYYRRFHRQLIARRVRWMGSALAGGKILPACEQFARAAASCVQLLRVPPIG